MTCLKVGLLVSLLQCAASSPQCDVLSSAECEAASLALLQHAVANKNKVEEIGADVQENEVTAVESIATGTPLDLTKMATQTIFCKAKPGGILTLDWFGHSYTVPATLQKCEKECQKEPEKCVGDGSHTDACACVMLTDAATKACEGKDKGASCSFEVRHDDEVLGVTEVSGYTEIKKESFHFESVCSDVSGNVRCEPWRGSRCYEAGTPCVYGPTTTSRSANDQTKILSVSEKTNYQLSYCETSPVLRCKTSFNPPAQ